MAAPAEPRYLLAWLLLFAGSGCAALIYEIVWFQLLQLVIGSSAVSLGLLLAAFMGGLCLGSAALPRLVSARLHPLRVYALLELGIGVLGIAALFGVPLIGRLYLAGPGAGFAGTVFRGVVAAVCLLPPTVLMGGSLPAIARWVQTTPRGISWLGLLYGANIAGAVIGCLGAGFYLLRVFDMAVATYAAAAINFTVALLAFVLCARTEYTPTQDETPAPRRLSTSRTLVYITIGLSGLTALGAEVVWTRLLSLMLGATVYTFSIILGIFLLGLWAGASAGSFLARRAAGDARLTLGVCQILLAAAIAWTAFTLAYALPYWPIEPTLSTSPWFTFDLDLTRCLRAIFPATLLWGASFPLALAGAAAGGEDPARLTGETYAANTAGSIAGALLFSLILIPAIGTGNSERLLLWLAAAAGAAALASAAVSITKRIAWTAAAVLLATALAATISDVPWQVTAYGRRVAPVLRGLDADLKPAEPLFVGEGRNASIAITQRGDQRFFYVSGKPEASSAPLDMRLQRMMGHLPALFHPAPRSVLVVGFGAGVTAGSFVLYPEVQHIVICELEPLIPPASGKYFARENYNVLDDPRTRVIYDDARHFVYTSSEKYDVITTDPIHPWVKGTSTLYSKEYYELVKDRLNPGGVVAQWLPIYESDEETVKTELATFFSVFPSGTVWSNFLNGDGYDLVLIGRADDSPIPVDALESRLNQPAYARIRASLGETGFPSTLDLLASYAGRGPDLAQWLTGAQINEDLNLRLQYLAGLGLNSTRSPQIYRDILAYRKFPEGLLTGSAERINALAALLGRPARTF
ncbi:MAG: SAM-dependent methyltransferase [Terriglobia bacterium]|nr:MAG: SAM-dependent methyltransferase [Terriglobia bacterium]